MDETPHIPPSSSDRIRPAQPARPDAVAGSRPASPAFEALLERLTARAAELEDRSHSLESPAQLPEAVDAARASLEDALTLGEQLLEAYRAAEQAGGSPEVQP
jgi:hypothetical protein